MTACTKDVVRLPSEQLCTHNENTCTVHVAAPGHTYMCGVLVGRPNCSSVYVATTWWSRVLYYVRVASPVAHFKRENNLGVRTSVIR